MSRDTMCWGVVAVCWPRCNEYTKKTKRRSQWICRSVHGRCFRNEDLRVLVFLYKSKGAEVGEWKTLLDVILCYPRPLYLHALPYYNQIVASVKEPSPWNAEAYFYPPNQRIVRQTSQLRPYSTQLGISTSTSGTHLGLRQGSRVRRRCRQSFIAGQCTVTTPTLPRLRPR